MTLEKITSNKVFGGWHRQYAHESTALNCKMRFAVFLPPQASEQKKVPVLYWLSGLTCTDENFMQKAGALRLAATLGLAIVAPDTSPRGAGVPDDEEGAYDLGLGAGFYVNATQAPWQDHYQMYEYIVSELPTLIEGSFPVSQNRALAGHSMGGHGALTIGLKNQETFQSISAFSPICNPTQTPWGQKAFTAYLGPNQADWTGYDACELMRRYKLNVPVLVDQGMDDQFLETELKVDHLKALVAENDLPVQVREQEGYDHSYYFISSFIEDHLRFHAKHLL